MNIPVTDEFKGVCSEIVAQGKTDDEWAAVESDDMFQTQNYVGGFDATEMAFCFSYFDPQGTEYWFQLTRSEVSEVAAGRKSSIELRPADKSWLGVQAVQPDQSAILSRLDQVIRAWPRGGASRVPVALQSLITSDFDVSDLLHDVSGVAELSQVESHGSRAIVEFLDKGGSPERATFIDVGANEWRLQSLKFQCSACFGSGRNLGDVCVLCNGAGWGAG